MASSTKEMAAACAFPLLKGKLHDLAIAHLHYGFYARLNSKLLTEF